MLGRQTVPRADLGEARQVLSHANESAHTRLSIDADYFTNWVVRRGHIEIGSSGDLLSIPFRLIDERNGTTEIFKLSAHVAEISGLQALAQG